MVFMGNRFFPALLLIFTCVLSFASDNNFINQWDYQVIIHSPGTSKEGRVGLIYYKGKKINYNFDSLLVPVGEYYFYQSTSTKGNYGYLRKSSNTSHESVTSKDLSRRELKLIIKKGYYSGQEKVRKTPNFWVRVEREGQFYWIHPEKIKHLIKLKRWNGRSPLMEINQNANTARDRLRENLESALRELN